MSEPDNASREDLTDARDVIIERLDVMHKAAELHHKAVEASVEGMRSQNSHEHGALDYRMGVITEAVHWIKKQWERFSRP